MLDELLVFVAPLLLGDGVRLFDRPGGRAVRLEPTHVGHTDLATTMWFTVAR